MEELIGQLTIGIGDNWVSIMIATFGVSTIAGLIGLFAHYPENWERYAQVGAVVTVITLVLLLTWTNIIAIVYFVAGNYELNERGCVRAIPHFEKSVEWGPLMFGPRRELIRCRQQLNQLDELLTFLTDADIAQETDLFYVYDMTQLYLEQDRLTELVQLATAFIHSDPEIYQWLIGIGIQFHRQQKFQYAEGLLSEIRTIDMDNYVVIHWLAWSLFEQEDYENAYDRFTDCIELGDVIPDNFLSRCYAGRGFTSMRMEHNAISDLVRASQLQTGQRDVLNALNSILITYVTK